MKQEQSYGVVPLRRSNTFWEVLLVQHASAKYWGFPKGHLEKGESPQQTAERELREETGLTIQRLLSESPYQEHYFFRKEQQLISKAVAYFPAEVTGELQLQYKEISAAQWVPIEEACASLTYETDRAVCRQALQLLKNF